MLLDAAGVELARDVTDHLGAYEFADVVDGSYVLELELPDGYDITLPDQGLDDEFDSDLVYRRRTTWHSTHGRCWLHRPNGRSVSTSG